MIVYAAIDLRGGRAVQLVGGQPTEQKVSLPEPVAVAQRWIAAGFPALHVVDLDAALGHGDNRAHIAEILDVATVPVQVGGGVRADDDVAALIAAGAARVIVGTRAIEDAVWRQRLAARYPRQLVIAADVRGDTITTRGWTEQTAIRVDGFLRGLADEPIAGILVTDVSREGRMIGVDVALFERLVEACPHAVFAAGGIRDLSDLRALAAAGVAGAVLGMSLYTGAIDPVEALTEFA